MHLIYCAAGNKRFSEIASASGFLLGARVPGTVYSPPFFCDQDWKNPNRTRYMEALAEHRPVMATVLDWEREEQFCEVMGWAQDAAVFAASVVIIPKIPDTIERIPHCVGGKPIVLGYSIPTKFGGTEVPIWELEGRRVHLLGGSPQRQMREWAAISGMSNVVSADGNMALKMAVTRCCYWRAESFGREGHWPSLKHEFPHDAPYHAFQRSCENMMQSWAQRGVV